MRKNEINKIEIKLRPTFISVKYGNGGRLKIESKLCL